MDLRSIWMMERPKGGLRQTIELKSIWSMRRQAVAAPDDRPQICMDDGTPKRGAAPDDRVQIYMGYWTPQRGLRQTIELRSIKGRQKGVPPTMELRSMWIMKRQKGAAPDDRAQIRTII